MLSTVSACLAGCAVSVVEGIVKGAVSSVIVASIIIYYFYSSAYATTTVAGYTIMSYGFVTCDASTGSMCYTGRRGRISCSSIFINTSYKH